MTFSALWCPSDIGIIYHLIAKVQVGLTRVVRCLLPGRYLGLLLTAAADRPTLSQPPEIQFAFPVPRHHHLDHHLSAICIVATRQGKARLVSNFVRGSMKAVTAVKYLKAVAG